MATKAKLAKQPASVLSPLVREQILGDYRLVNDALERIFLKERNCHVAGPDDIHPHPLRGIGGNGYVGGPDYIHPTVRVGSQPFNDPRGEFQYYSRIRAALEAALTTGRIPRRLAPPRAPKYISDLVK